MSHRWLQGDFFWGGFFTFLGPSIEAWMFAVPHFNDRLPPDLINSKEGRNWRWGATRAHVRETGREHHDYLREETPFP